MNLYAESSAVLGWLLEEESGAPVRDLLREAELVLASDLTLVECERVLIRSVRSGRIDESAAAGRKAHLRNASESWHLLRVSEEILERARRPFPSEPVRTLDALHLSSALSAASAVPELELLSLDDRVRTCAEALGLDTVPAGPTRNP